MRSALNARPTASQGVAPAAAPNANPPAPGVPEVVPFCSAHVVPFYSALDISGIEPKEAVMYTVLYTVLAHSELPDLGSR